MATDGMTGLERLIAIEEIKLLKSRRDRAVDTHDWALYEALHAPDHRSLGQDYGQWTSAAQMIANTRLAMRGLRTLHQSHTPVIAFATPVKANGIWAMKGLSFWEQDGAPHWFLAVGHYDEEYQKRDGIWKFTGRALTYSHTERSPGAIFPPKIDAVTAEEAQPATTPVAFPTMPAGMSHLDRLLAVQAIEDLVARRDHALDTRDWDALCALHAPDHVIDGVGRWTSVPEMIGAVRERLGPGTVSVHHSHTGDIGFETPTRATGIWPVEDTVFDGKGGDAPWRHGFGFAHETYKRRDGRWLFTTRRVTRTHVHGSAAHDALAA
jgi:hypothetical protein